MNANELADYWKNYRHSVTMATETESMLRQQQAEIEALKEVNTKQVNYIAEQKLAYEKLWKEHMELFWKHEQDKDLTNEQ